MLIRFDAHFTYNCPRSILHMKPRGMVTSARPESDIEVLILKLGRHNARVGRCIVHTCKRHIIHFSRKKTHTHTHKKKQQCLNHSSRPNVKSSRLKSVRDIKSHHHFQVVITTTAITTRPVNGLGATVI